MNQENIDQKNAAFWNELCGTGLAQSLGITDQSPKSLRQFDEAYLGFYPYLEKYVSQEVLSRKDVLEIGLGYGTLGQQLASRGCVYHGLDISNGPVSMMQYRLGHLPGGKDIDEKQRVKVGSALDIPFADAGFDYVYSIGCLHHTGDLEKAVSEVHRVLRPGGKAIVMLYNRYSFRQIFQVPLARLTAILKPDGRGIADRVRASYDKNAEGEAAPFTEFVSPRQVRRLFNVFSRVTMDRQNFDTYVFFGGRIVILRDRLLKNVARILGLDLYISAVK